MDQDIASALSRLAESAATAGPAFWAALAAVLAIFCALALGMRALSRLGRSRQFRARPSEQPAASFARGAQAGSGLIPGVVERLRADETLVDIMVEEKNAFRNVAVGRIVGVQREGLSCRIVTGDPYSLLRPGSTIRLGFPPVGTNGDRVAGLMTLYSATAETGDGGAVWQFTPPYAVVATSRRDHIRRRILDHRYAACDIWFVDPRTVSAKIFDRAPDVVIRGEDAFPDTKGLPHLLNVSMGGLAANVVAPELDAETPVEGTGVVIRLTLFDGEVQELTPLLYAGEVRNASRGHPLFLRLGIKFTALAKTAADGRTFLWAALPDTGERTREIC